MSILKQPDEMALHVLTANAHELLEKLRTGQSLSIGDARVEEKIMQEHEQLEEALQRLDNAMRECGFLPAAGNVELAEINALAMKAKAMVAEGTNQVTPAEVLANDIQALGQQVDACIRELDDKHALQGSLRDFGKRIERIEKSLRR